jgi:Phage tail protein RIFT-related domain
VLTRLEVLGLRSLVPTLPLDEDGVAGNDPIQVLDIQGLQPVKASITTTPFGAFDGEAYVGSSVGKRNIVLTIGLNPNWAIQTIEELRQLLYNYFMPKLLVQLRFHSSNFPVVKIEGYVESVEPNIFVKTPTMVVSIICPEPDFLAVDLTTVTGITNDGTDWDDILYIGSVETGFNLQITQAVGTPGTNTIQISLTGQYAPQVFPTKGNLTSDIRWEMSSIPGGKYIRSVSMVTGAVQNFLNDLAADAMWPVLYPGPNKIAVVTPVVGQNWELTYYARFGGL